MQKKHYNAIIAIVAIFLIVLLTISFNGNFKAKITETEDQRLAGQAYTRADVQEQQDYVSKPSTKCVDSDRLDYQAQGKCVDSNGEYYDSCETATRVKEYMCTELKECVPIIINCLPDYGNKCEGGSCLFVTRT